jgi:hypothetical protein
LDDEDEPLATITMAAKKKPTRRKAVMEKKQKPTPVTPVRTSPRRKAADETSAPMAVVPTTKSRKRKASVLAAATSTPVFPRRKVLGLSTTGSARVNVNQGLTNKMLRSYGVPCLDDDEEDAMAAGARCGRGARAVAVRQWRRERSGLPTAACLRESNP